MNSSSRMRLPQPEAEGRSAASWQQVHGGVSKLSNIDNNERKGVIGERGEGFFTDARHPQKHELACLDVDLAIKGKHGNVLTDPFVGDQRHRPESHVNIVSHKGFGPISAQLQISSKRIEVVGYLVGAHPDQR